MNRNDITVVEVVSENHRTVIRADITYQASALLGGVKQDEVMRLKVDRVMDRVKMELGTQGVRVEAVSWFADPTREPGYVMDEGLAVEPEPVFRPESTRELARAIEQGHARELEQRIEPEPETEPLPVMEVAHITGPEDSLEPVAHGEQEQFVEHQLTGVAEPIVAAEGVREPESEAIAEQAGSGQSVVQESVFVAEVAEKPTATERVPVVEVAKKPVAAAASSSEKKSGAIPMFRTFHSVETKPPRRWGLLATVVCMLAALGLFLAWPYLAGLLHERLHPSSSVSDGKSAEETLETPKPAEDPTAAQLPDANLAATRNAAMLSESDPKVWLESWANALSGQDAGVQASFYADPVEHYAVKTNVSNADVWLDKKNEIQSRPKNSTVTIEKVEIEPRPDESLRVRLTKHFTSKSDSGRVSDQFIHSQLALRKIDGQWKITSEQNLRP
jgi:hypothetical protein